MKSLLFFVFLVHVLYVTANDVTCKKKGKFSKTVTIGSGDSYSFKTQAKKKYGKNVKCSVTYKRDSSCPKLKFSCSKFNIDNTNAKKCSGKTGDRMMIQEQGSKKAKSYCKKNSPDVSTTSNFLKVSFISNKKKHSTGAQCMVECESDTTTPTSTGGSGTTTTTTTTSTSTTTTTTTTFGASGTSNAMPGWNNQDLEQIKSTVAEFMTDNSVVGCSLALVKDGRLVYANGFGVMDRDSGIPVNSTTLFRIASLSKPITAAAIMMLSEKNPGLLNRTVFGPNGILGSIYGTKPYSDFEKQVTIKQLLEHTAGGEAWDNQGGDDPMNEHLSYDHNELFGWVLDNKDPSSKPGTKYAYSNFGYNVLGRVIEKLTGQSYENFVQDNILKPSGATEMKIGRDTKPERFPNEVTYHSSYAYGRYNVKRRDANGGWISSAADYARFLMVFDGSSTKPDLISRSTYDVMIQGSSVNPSYAKGWSVNPNHDNIWHSGNFAGTNSYGINVARKQWGDYETSAVFITNSDAANISPLLWKIQRGIKNWPSNVDLS